MKKFLVRGTVVLIILIILAALGVHFFLDAAIKRGVETIGPRVTKVDVKVDAITLSILSGSGKIRGLVVGNPPGFKTPSAIHVGTASLALVPGTLLNDKVVIKSINVEAPEITFETDLTSNNLSKLLDNVKDTSGGGKEPPPAQKPGESAKPPKKLQVDDFVIRGGKVHVSITPLNQSATVPLPDIHLTKLGTGPEGITPAELTELIIQEIVKAAESQAGTVVTDIGKGAQYIGGSLKTNLMDKATKGIGDLFKKKN
jgi:hypothetical protein